MGDKYLEAVSYVDKGRIKYKYFKLIEDGKIKKRYNEKEDQMIIQKMEDSYIRPTGSLRNHEAFIKKELFVNYVDKYLFLDTEKKKKNNRKPVSKYKWQVFIGAATVIAILSLGSKYKDVAASENNDTAITTEATTTEETSEKITEDVIPISNEEELAITPTQEITKETDKENTFTENDIDTTIINTDFEDIFQFSAENNTGLNNDNNRIVDENYGISIDENCYTYGMDNVLARKIICQENPLNAKTNPYAHGPAQTEYIHGGEEVTCYNHVTKQNETITVDLERIDNDKDYAMKVFIMMYMSQFNYINNNYGYKLTDAELIDITTLSYNFGQSIVTDGLYYTDTYEDAIKYIYEHRQGGDPLYREHVYSYIDDGTIITIKDNNDINHSAIFDNTNINDFESDNTREIKAMAH